MKNYFKKMAALWVVGCLAAAGSLFALDLGNGFTLSGEVVSGLNIVSQDDDNDDTDDTKFKLWHDDEGAPRFRLNAAYAGDAYGVKGRLQYQAGAFGGFAFGWAKFGKYASLYAGVIDDNHFGTGGVIDKNLDAVTGVKLIVTPIEALTLGFALPVAINGWTSENQFKNMVFGAKYAHKLVTVSAALRLSGAVEGAYDGTNPPDDVSATEVVFDVNTAPVPGLGIDISGYFGSESEDYLGGRLLASDALGYSGFRLAPKVSYSTGPISVYLLADIRTDGNDADGKKGDVEADGDAQIKIELQGQYAVGKYFAPFLRFGINNVGWMDGTGAYVRIGTPIKLGNGVSFDVWDEIGCIGADSDINNIKNTVQLNFSYTF